MGTYSQDKCKPARHQPTPSCTSPAATIPVEVQCDLLDAARLLCLDDMPWPALAAEVYRLADCAGVLLADPEGTVRQWLGYAEEAQP